MWHHVPACAVRCQPKTSHPVSIISKLDSGWVPRIWSCWVNLCYNLIRRWERKHNQRGMLVFWYSSGPTWLTSRREGRQQVWCSWCVFFSGNWNVFILTCVVSTFTVLHMCFTGFQVRDMKLLTTHPAHSFRMVVVGLVDAAFTQMFDVVCSEKMCEKDVHALEANMCKPPSWYSGVTHAFFWWTKYLILVVAIMFQTCIFSPSCGILLSKIKKQNMLWIRVLGG